jgi:hypothetical protein
MATPALRGEAVAPRRHMPPYRRFGEPFYWVSPHLVKRISAQDENFFA